MPLDAFASDSRAGEHAFTAALPKQIQRIGNRRYGWRALRGFRGETNLSAALRVRDVIAQHPKRILITICAGTLTWDGARNDGDPAPTDVLPLRCSLDPPKVAVR